MLVGSLGRGLRGRYTHGHCIWCAAVSLQDECLGLTGSFALNSSTTDAHVCGLKTFQVYYFYEIDENNRPVGLLLAAKQPVNIEHLNDAEFMRRFCRVQVIFHLLPMAQCFDGNGSETALVTSFDFNSEIS